MLNAPPESTSVSAGSFMEPGCGKNKQAEFVPVMAGDHDIDRHVREVLQGFKADVGCADPGSAHQLKVF